EVQVGVAKERRLAVELQIVFALQDVVKHAEAGTDRRLTAPRRVIREAETRGPIVLNREVRSSRGALVAREQEADRSVREPRRLLALLQGERPSLRVDLRRAVLIAHAEVHRQAFGDAPFILREKADIVRADVRRRLAELQVLV